MACSTMLLEESVRTVPSYSIYLITTFLQREMIRTIPKLIHISSLSLLIPLHDQTASKRHRHEHQIDDNSTISLAVATRLTTILIRPSLSPGGLVSTARFAKSPSDLGDLGESTRYVFTKLEAIAQ